MLQLSAITQGIIRDPFPNKNLSTYLPGSKGILILSGSKEEVKSLSRQWKLFCGGSGNELIHCLKAILLRSHEYNAKL